MDSIYCASAFEQDIVTPDAVPFSDAFADADFPEAIFLMKPDACFVFREDFCFQGPKTLLLRSLNKGLHKLVADAFARISWIDINAHFPDTRLDWALRYK